MGRPLLLVVCCAYCRKRIGAVEVDGTWSEAEKWAYLARVAHERRSCKRRRARR